MKIVNKKQQPRYPSRLGEMEPGDTVKFEEVFNHINKRNALFLVLRVPGEYVAEDKRRDKDSGEFRILVANVETGLTSLVLRGRKVRFVESEVHFDD